MNAEILDKAAKFCEEHKHRFTEPRKAVLSIISQHSKPLSAYEVLDKLGKVLDNPKPPTAYRAIEFWESQGFIHRIESLNAYTMCKAGHQHEGSQFMICGSCGDIEEAHMCSMPEALKKTTSQKGFETKSWNLEIFGTCNKCQ